MGRSAALIYLMDLFPTPDSAARRFTRESGQSIAPILTKQPKSATLYTAIATASAPCATTAEVIPLSLVDWTLFDHKPANER